MTDPAPGRRLLVLGGTPRHRGGLEAFCERAVQAVGRHAPGWRAEWWPTEAAYLSPRRLGPLRAALHRMDALTRGDLVWLQWSTLADLLFLHRAAAWGVPVLVTPHLGARARLQRVAPLRAGSRRLLARADRLALLFADQAQEIALPAGVPRDTIGTFLPEAALAAPVLTRAPGPLRLIHAGRLSAAKGAFRTVELCAALRARAVPFSARIVGRAEPAVAAALSAAIRQAGLGDALVLEDWLEETELRAALGAADLLVHLSELDSFPLIVLEALAAGAVPVVADMAGAADLVHRFGGFVTAGSSAASAADWIAAQDPTALRRAGAAGAACVRSALAWPQVVAGFERIAALMPAR